VVNEAVMAWGVLLTVLVLVASGRFRFELVALSGLFLLGLAGVTQPGNLFLGMGNPAIITIGAVFIISRGITESGVLSGLGLAIAARVRTARSQILSLSLVTSFLSALMNNVGAIGLIMPTALRMSSRTGLCKGAFGLPLAYASILGGTLTLIGSAPNIIVSTYLLEATGEGYRMFDFAPYGLAMFFSGLVLWFICRACGFTPGAWKTPGDGAAVSLEQEQEQESGSQVGMLITPERRRTLLVVGLAVVILAVGPWSPAVVFGTAALLLIIVGVLKPEHAYDSLDLTILLFLGAMLGISSILEETGGLKILGTTLFPFVEQMPRFVLLAVLFFVSSFLSNIMNNSAAAAVMAPVALTLGPPSTSENLPAMMMAVAMGSNLAVILPTHQATLMVLARAPFNISTYMKSGVVLTVVAGFAAVVVINFLL